MLSTKKFTGARQVVTDSHSLSLATRVPRPGPAAGPGLGIAWARAAHFDAPPHRPIPTNRATVTFQFTTTFRGRTIRVPVCTNWGMTTDTPFARAGPWLGRPLEARQAGPTQSHGRRSITAWPEPSLSYSREQTGPRTRAGTGRGAGPPPKAGPEHCALARVSGAAAGHSAEGGGDSGTAPRLRGYEALKPAHSTWGQHSGGGEGRRHGKLWDRALGRFMRCRNARGQPRRHGILFESFRQ